MLSIKKHFGTFLKGSFVDVVYMHVCLNMKTNTYIHNTYVGWESLVNEHLMPHSLRKSFTDFFNIAVFSYQIANCAKNAIKLLAYHTEKHKPLILKAKI